MSPLIRILPTARPETRDYLKAIIYHRHDLWRVLSKATNNFSTASPQQRSTRSFSSRGGRKRRDGFKLDALPFSISPEEALERFRKWSVDDQGLNWLMSWNSIGIGAAYVPVWSFDLNIRYVVTDSNGKKRYDWKPPVFQNSYGNQPVIHLAGLGSYAGKEAAFGIEFLSSSSPDNSFSLVIHVPFCIQAILIGGRWSTPSSTQPWFSWVRKHARSKSTC